MSEPLTAEEVDRVRQIAETAPDTEIGRLFVRLAVRATPAPDTLLLALWRVAEAARAHTDAECSCLAVNWTHDDDCALVTTEYALRKALAALAATREETT